MKTKKEVKVWAIMDKEELTYSSVGTLMIFDTKKDAEHIVNQPQNKWTNLKITPVLITPIIKVTKK